MMKFSGEQGVAGWTAELDFPNPEPVHMRSDVSSPPGLVYAGARSLQTEIKPGDPPVEFDFLASDPMAHTQRRAEYSWKSFRFNGNGEVGWFGGAFYLPSDPMATVNGASIFQLSNDPDPGEMLQIYCFSGRFRVSTDGPSPNHELLNIDLSPLLDRWNSLVCCFTTTNEPNGFIKLWLNGELVIDYNGPTKSNGARGPYLRHGLNYWGYDRFDTSKNARVLHDNLTVARSHGSYEAVDPAAFERTDGSKIPTSGASPLYGGAFAPWAIPASEIATHPKSQELVREIYNATPGSININVDRFSPAIYDLQDADATITFRRTSTKFGGNLDNGVEIPWNFSQFMTPKDFDQSDSDSYTILVDSKTGRCFEFFQSKVVGGQLHAGRGTLLKTGVVSGFGDANVFSKQNGNRHSRACGIQHVVGLVLRSEIDAGHIPHAMTLAYPNPTRFAHEAPAIKGAGGTGGPAGRGFMGLRIVWDLSNENIENWVSGLAADIRTPMRVVANCIREFGMIVTDHGGNRDQRRASTQFEHTLTGKWGEIGISNASVLTALHALLGPNRSKARVLDIPDHAGGSDAGVACYPGVSYPSGHPCNSS